MEERRIAAAREPPKRIAVFIDGTWNTQANNTNVWRLYSLCRARDDGDKLQLCFYTKGVGTAYGDKVRGGLFGRGIAGLITDPYEWLIGHYNPGDEVFIFGFSRGAFAARSVAGLIARCGILKPGSPIGIGELFARYNAGFQEKTLYQLLDERQRGVGTPTNQLEKWMLDYAQPAKIKMVGVWDTVGALKFYRGVLDTGLRLSLENAFHALAIDEHRQSFAPTLWTRNIHLPEQAAVGEGRELSSVEQRWFVGAHANVGGGYNSDLLPQIPLQWLMKKAADLGLAFRENVKEDDAVYAAKVADSFRQFGGGAYYLYKGGRPYYRTIGAPPKVTRDLRTETVNETIDASVFERWRRNSGYRPANLVDWAKRCGVDPAQLVGNNLAMNGTPMPER